MRHEPTDRGDPDATPRVIARRSRATVALFDAIFALSLRRSFHAVRLATAVRPPHRATPRLVIYTNHPSWWDAVTYAFVARHFLPGRAMYAPIDAAMIARYPFMARCGAFGVRQRSPRGALDFLATSRAILADPRNFLVVACQSRFADVRERPLAIGAGLAHLSARVEDATFVPLAIEYAFWEERRPEMLLRFGEPIGGPALAGLPVEARRALLEEGLEVAMAALAGASVARDARGFATLVAGAKGVNPVYDVWRRLKATAAGRAFDPRHGGGA